MNNIEGRTMLTATQPCDHDNRLEDCLRLNNQLKLLLDYSPNLFLILDDEGNYAYANSNLLNMMGITDDAALVGKPIRSLYEKLQDESLVARNRKRYYRLKSGEEPGFVEDEEINWPTVGKRSYQITFRRLPFHDNSLDRILIIFNDVTEVRRQEAERRMNDLLSSTQLPAMVWDDSGNIVDCNEEAFQIFGIAKNCTAGKYNHIMDATHPDNQPDGRKTEDARQEFLREVLDKGFARIEALLMKADGTPLPFGITGARITWHSGSRIVVYLADLTEVKAKENEVREAEERIRIMLDAMPMSCTFFDENLNIVDCNQGSLTLFGEPDKQTYLDNFFEYAPEYQPGGAHSKEEAKRCIKETFEKGGKVVQWLHQTHDGDPLPAEVTLVRVKHKDAYIVVGYARDLREIIKMTAEADDANERNKLMLDSTPLICILRDENSRVIDCNQEALKVFGVAGKADFIENYQKCYPDFQADGTPSVFKIKEMLQAALETGKISSNWTFQLPSGEILPVDTTLVRIPWKNTFNVLSYSRDLREELENEKKMEESLEKNRSLEIQTELAQAASEAKSQFLASMSHEIRTPMNTIIGLLDLMRTDNLDAKQRHYIQDLKHMSQVLLEIINDILDFHKIEEGIFELIPVHFILSSLFDHLVSQNKVLAESKKLTFISNLAEGLPQCLYGDELRIRQIVTNLISNAIKYTQNGYVIFSVDFVVEGGNEYIAFTVEDSGIGIEEENFSVLFDRFEQFDRRKNRGIPGTGLGLPIAKNLAKMMGGYIRFNSEYCKGSMFTFLLPLVEGNSEQIVRTTDFDRVVAKPDTKVLVVDDNPGNITVAVGLLARHGIFPHTATNGLQAIEMVQKNSYDLVFMDHMMPEMDGVQATKIIRQWEGKNYDNLPIIALSANAVAGARELFTESGMNDFISKPIIGTELNRVLQRWLPKNKIDTAKPKPQTVAPPQDDVSINELLQKLTKIDDLSIISGITRVGGDKKLYLDILRKFSQNVPADVKALKDFATDDKWKDYTIRVHALKSVFATIGNKNLSDWAFRLAEAAAQGDRSKCINETRSFCDHVSNFQKKLMQANLMTDNSTPVTKQKITHRVLKGKLELLLQACQDFQPETAEPLAEELMGITLTASEKVSSAMDSSLASISDLVHSFEYDNAIEKINKLLRFL